MFKSRKHSNYQVTNPWLLKISCPHVRYSMYLISQQKSTWQHDVSTVLFTHKLLKLSRFLLSPIKPVRLDETNSWASQAAARSALIVFFPISPGEIYEAPAGWALFCAGVCVLLQWWEGMKAGTKDKISQCFCLLLSSYLVF